MNEFPLPNLVYSRTFRFALDHIAKLSDLSQRLRMDQSEIVRLAVDEFFARHAEDQPQPQPAEKEA